MALTREQKQVLIDELKDRLQRAEAIVLVNYGGIKVSEDIELRAKLREAGVDYKVYKNRIIKIAMHACGMNDCDLDLKGSTAIAISYDDVVAPAKVIKEASKTIKVLNFKSGIVEGKLMNIDGLNALASVPSKETLVAQILGLLQGTIAGLARGLAAVAEKKEA